MYTAVELTVQEHLNDLMEVADAWSWPVIQVNSTELRIELPAKDSSRFAIHVNCDGFIEKPPALHWCNPDTGELDKPEDTPKGSGYLHGSGVICAPWNRLAYKQCNPRGPHSDWQLSNWMENPKTGSTTTVTAMILRIFHELNGANFQGRMNAK